MWGDPHESALKAPLDQVHRLDRYDVRDLPVLPVQGVHPEQLARDLQLLQQPDRRVQLLGSRHDHLRYMSPRHKFITNWDSVFFINLCA
jgi:hypothetical protein